MALILYPAVLETYLNHLIEVRAEAGLKWFVDDALSRPGTGLLHVGSPNQSSAAGEYPAEQLGALKRSFDSRPAGRLTRAIGSFADKDAEGHRQAMELEARPEEKGGRHMFEKALAEGELVAVLLRGGP